MLMLTLMRLCLCLCASENSIRQISGFVLLMFLLMLTLMSRVFSLVTLMLCLCASEDQRASRFTDKSCVNKPICTLSLKTNLVQKKNKHVICRLRVGPYGEKL